jgi:uncharacterized membrane protein HdeD (DUF308 family)
MVYTLITLDSGLNHIERKEVSLVVSLGRFWWAVLLRGVIAIIFGIIALIRAEFATTALVYIFGAYAVVDGILSVANAWPNRKLNPGWGITFVQGLAGITAGFVVIFLIDFVAFVLIYLIAVWALISGILEIITAIRLRAEIQNEWALALSGVLSIILGVVLIIWPSIGILTVVWAVGIYAILFGLLMLYLAFLIRRSPFAGGEVLDRIEIDRGG